MKTPANFAQPPFVIPVDRFEGGRANAIGSCSRKKVFGCGVESRLIHPCLIS